MSTELKTIVNVWVAIIGVGVALAGLIFTTQGSLREEMRDEFKVQRAETQAEFRAVRAEMQDEFKAVRAEMQTLRSETQAEFNTQREITTNLLGRMAHVEGLLEGLREAFAGWRADAVAKAPERYDPH